MRGADARSNQTRDAKARAASPPFRGGELRYEHLWNPLLSKNAGEARVREF